MADRDTLARTIWSKRTLRGDKTLPDNPITGRQSSNVEVVRGDSSIPLEGQKEIAKAYMEGIDVGGLGVGAFDTLEDRNLMGAPGEIATRRFGRNPSGHDPDAAARFLAQMQTSPSPGWQPGPVPNSQDFQEGVAPGPWKSQYPIGGTGISNRFRPSYNLLRKL